VKVGDGETNLECRINVMSSSDQDKTDKKSSVNDRDSLECVEGLNS
jgi:hypothetical protein